MYVYHRGVHTKDSTQEERQRVPIPPNNLPSFKQDAMLRIGHFRVAVNLTMKARLSAKLSYEN